MARVQLTEIEKLDREFPQAEIEKTVSKMLDSGAELEPIAVWVKEKTSREVSSRWVSHYKQKRWLAQKRRIQARVDASEAIMEVVGRRGISNVTQAEIYRLVDEAMREGARLDPEFLLKEQRLWAVHTANLEKIETEKKKLEIENQKLSESRERERQQVEDAVTQKDPKQAIDEIRQIYNLG